MLKNLLLLILCISVGKVGCLLLIPTEIIITLVEHLRLSQSTILLDTLIEFNDKIKLIRDFSNSGYRISSNYHNIYKDQFLIMIINSLGHYNWDAELNGSVLIVTRMQNEKELNQLNLRIDNEIYFFDQVSLKFYETYTINNHHTTRYLGKFHNDNHITNFNPTYNEPHSVLCNRRGDFKGITLEAMVENLYPYADIAENWTTIASYFPNNQTYDVTDLATGSYIDVLHTLEKYLNFSTRLYIRKDRKWGFPISLSNGSEIVTGMFESLVQDSAKFIWASLYTGPERQRYIDYLPILSVDHLSFYISNHETYETINWKLYLSQFSVELWLTILFTSVMITVITVFIHWVHTKNILVTNYK